ncbi:unnamed protein product [Amoebophrya sp. A25]|nr:unnamed protein product [Amoebophrya sp. A25]|eukprot:GSA25T00015800001.1
MSSWSLPVRRRSSGASKDNILPAEASITPGNSDFANTDAGKYAGEIVARMSENGNGLQNDKTKLEADAVEGGHDETDPKYPTAASNPFAKQRLFPAGDALLSGQNAGQNGDQQAFLVVSSVNAGMEQGDRVVEAYLQGSPAKQELGTQIRGSAEVALDVEAAHERFMRECVTEQRTSADNTFKSWMTSFRESPQVAQALAQSYAAVVVAREGRIVKMHEQFCKLLSKKIHTDGFYQAIREKCRADVLKVYLKEKWESQRLFVQEKWSAHREQVRVWGDVCMKQQDEITKRIESGEITKRLNLRDRKYYELAIMATIAFVVSSRTVTFSGRVMTATLTRSLAVARRFGRRAFFLFCALFVFMYHYRAQCRDKLSSMGQDVLRRSVERAVSLISAAPGGELVNYLTPGAWRKSSNMSTEENSEHNDVPATPMKNIKSSAA